MNQTEYNHNYYINHKEKLLADNKIRRKQWDIDNAEHLSEYRRNWDLTRRYNISASQYDDMLLQQGGVCAICGTKPANKRLHVDHDHETSEIRGLLCFRCNTAVGSVKNNPVIALSLAKYLNAF